MTETISKYRSSGNEGGHTKYNELTGTEMSWFGFRIIDRGQLF